MTKFIIHGGSTSRPHKWNKEFFHEIIRDLKNNSQVLICYFSREEKEYDKLLEQDKKNFLDNANGKKLKLVMASKDNFIKQIKQSDAIYIRGGKVLKLLNTLKEHKDAFRKAIKHKIVAASSAGAYVLSKYFYSNDEKNIFEGLDILPIVIMCHYNGQRKIVTKLEELANKYNLKIILLKDCEYEIIEE